MYKKLSQQRYIKQFNYKSKKMKQEDMAQHTENLIK